MCALLSGLYIGGDNEGGGGGAGLAKEGKKCVFKLALGGCGGGGGGWCVCNLANYSVAYEETQSNRESPIFVILCALCFHRQSFLTFILLCCSWCCALWRP